MEKVFHSSGKNNSRQIALGIVATLILMADASGWATEGAPDATVDTGTEAVENTNSHNMQARDTGIALNGSNMESSSINNNRNNLTTGNNTNLNLVAPSVSIPTSTSSAGGTGGTGGNAVLMLPRNPLPLSNAAFGRSNFGLQFGLQNNPILGGLGGLGGKQNALGWFMQAGLTIPFGKIPNINQAQNNQLDEIRRMTLDQQRNVLGKIPSSPHENRGNDPIDYKTKVNGKITGMSAYNYGTMPFSKVELMKEGLSDKALSVPQPRLLALNPAEVYTKPLNIGEKIGVVEVGNEYPYLGHTRSGWVKILLPNGTSGWTSTLFEYIKNDYTEVDGLAVAPGSANREKTAAVIQLKKENREDHGDKTVN